MRRAELTSSPRLDLNYLLFQINDDAAMRFPKTDCPSSDAAVWRLLLSAPLQPKFMRCLVSPSIETNNSSAVEQKNAAKFSFIVTIMPGNS